MSADLQFGIGQHGGVNFCATHATWYAPGTHCLHCVTAALIGELRRAVATLEARIADLEAQQAQDRAQCNRMLGYLQDAQRRHNAAAAREDDPC